MSDSSQPSGSGGIRASDSDREATVLILNKALGDGRINASEHDQRMSAALTEDRAVVETNETTVRWKPDSDLVARESQNRRCLTHPRN